MTTGKGLPEQVESLDHKRIGAFQAFWTCFQYFNARAVAEGFSKGFLVPSTSSGLAGVHPELGAQLTWEARMLEIKTLEGSGKIDLTIPKQADIECPRKE